MNIKAFEERIPKGTAALIVSEENRLYFTGFSASDGFLISTCEGSRFLTDGRYIEAAREKIKDCEVVLLEPGETYEQIRNAAKNFGAFRFMVEASKTSISTLNEYKKNFSDFSFDISNDLDKLIASFRMVKNAEEKGKIQKAQTIAETAFKKILPLIKPGVMELEIAAALDYEMRVLGAEAVSFDTIVVAGENTSKPHGVPSTNKVKKGDFITLDFGAVYDGYHSDTTRTLAVGTITSKMANVYDLVLEAQRCGIMALEPGCPAKAVDDVCRQIINDGGFGDCFTHSTGHGVGVEIHELPNLSSRTKPEVLLEVGNVVTVEPGIYIAGEFGVRIEDMLMITETGSYDFVTLPNDIITL